MPDPQITKIENIYFAHQIENMGTDYNGFNQVYQKGSTLSLTPCVVRIHTSIGVTGECLGPPVPENVDAQGHVLVPQGPGLGVEMDWDYIEGHKRGETVFE